MPFRAESSSFRAYSARKPFPFHVCTMDADGSGNKRLTEKSEEKDKTAYRLVQIEPNSICCYFIIWKGYFLETQIKWAGGQLRSLQKNQNPCIFFAGTLGMLASFVSVRLLVAFHQCLFYVGSPVENLAAYLCVRQNSIVAVVLQGSPAYFQQVCHFLVRQQFIAIGRWLPFLQQLFEQGQQPVEIRVERLYPLVVLFSDFITHMLLILGYTLFLKFSQMVLPFQRASLRFSSTLPTTRSTSSGR